MWKRAPFYNLSCNILSTLDSTDFFFIRHTSEISHQVHHGEASLDLSYCFVQGDNDPAPEAFKSAFLNLPLYPEKYECYIGSYTYTIPAGSFGLRISALLVTYEVLLYGQVAKKPRKEY
jgi:hypothetical protein